MHMSVVHSPCQERLQNQSWGMASAYKFHITDFMPHRLHVNHVRREDALQQQTMFLPQAEIKTQHKLLLFSDINFTSQKCCISQLAVALCKSKSNNWQTNGQINHPYWISSSCCDYLHVLFFFVLCRRFCATPWGSIASNDRALWVVLGCIRSAMEKYHPHCLWVIQQTHVCITQNNCLASISKNLVLPLSLLLSCPVLSFFFFSPVTDTNKKSNKAQASEMVAAEQEMILTAPHNSLWWKQAHYAP